jgi:DNA-3-methyladenine glycosylase I
MSAGDKTRCPWAGHDPAMRRYHDREWGVPVHDDRRLFEMLVLEGAQAGLSWDTILRKREGYRRAFEGFDIARIARFDGRRLQRLMRDDGIVKNRLKIQATVRNAKAALAVQREWESLDKFLWRFVDGKPVQNARVRRSQLPAQTPQSKAMSKALKAAGFSFVGPTVCYAFMQAVGMVNDHLTCCFRWREVQRFGRRPRAVATKRR